MDAFSQAGERFAGGSAPHTRASRSIRRDHVGREAVRQACVNTEQPTDKGTNARWQ
jgi:hypothetical protein